MPDLTRSPFPGMDPWMELRWGDTHGKLAAYAADALNLVLPADLHATMEERVVLDSATQSSGKPEVLVREEPAAFPFDSTSSAGTTATALLADPVTIRIKLSALEADPIIERYVNVRNSNERLITTIEWISPTNKIDPLAKGQFHAKRLRVLRRGANAVEIDLTRQGNPGGRQRLLEPLVVPKRQQSEYVAVARRATDTGQAEVYAVGLRDRLPAIRIPLRPTDADVPLDLQALIDATWRNGRYWQTDYARPLDPPLTPPDAAWAAERVAAWRGEPAAQ